MAPGERSIKAGVVGKVYKIAIVVDSLHGGGAEKVCLLLAKAFKRLAMHVNLVVVKPQCEYEIDADLHVDFLLNKENEKLYKKSVQLKAASKLRELAERVGGFDLVLSNLDGAHPIVSKVNLPNTWYVVHNSIDEKLKRAFRLGPLKYFRQKAVYKVFSQKNLVAVSRGLQKELQEARHIVPGQVACIYNPVDVEGITATFKKGGETLDQRYVIHVGRFARLKRHDILFEAFNYLIHTLHENVKLVLLCDVSSKLQRLIKKYKLQDHVVLPGFQQQPYLWMKNAEALVLSSDAEGFGLVLVEAMLCGTPVVSTRCMHGPDEILTGALESYLSPVGDPIKLAINIKKAMDEKPNVENAEIFQHIQPDIAAKNYLKLIPSR